MGLQCQLSVNETHQKKKVKSSSCSCCQSHSIVAECICFFSPPKRINMALNDFPDAWISCLMLLLARTRNCLVIPALSFQSLSPGFFLLLSLKNTYKILSGAAWFCSYVIFSHNLPSFAATHTHHSALIPGCLALSPSLSPSTHTHTPSLADCCLSNICLSGVFLLM